jgi:hypothetical protein
MAASVSSAVTCVESSSPPGPSPPASAAISRRIHSPCSASARADPRPVVEPGPEPTASAAAASVSAAPFSGAGVRSQRPGEERDAGLQQAAAEDQQGLVWGGASVQAEVGAEEQGPGREHADEGEPGAERDQQRADEPPGADQHRARRDAVGEEAAEQGGEGRRRGGGQQRRRAHRVAVAEVGEADDQGTARRDHAFARVAGGEADGERGGEAQRARESDPDGKARPIEARGLAEEGPDRHHLRPRTAGAPGALMSRDATRHTGSRPAHTLCR